MTVLSKSPHFLGGPAGRPWRVTAASVAQQAGIGLALVVLVAAFALAAPDFLSVRNLSNVLMQVTINLILATGMTFAILVGGIDLSVGAVMALCAVLSAMVLTLPSLPVGLAIVLAVVTALGAGTVCGAINGLVSSWWRVPSFIVTLGMLNVARGAALQATHARTIYDFPDSFTQFGTARLLYVPVVFLLALALLAIGWVILTRTVFGRLIYAIGNNEEAVRLAGHRTLAIKVAAFTITGFTVGIAAVVYMARLTIANPILGNGFELNAIAAVIIGGTSLSGGRGSLIGTMLGAIIIGVLANGLILLGVSDFFRQIITGAVIIAAVVLDSYRARFGRAA